ncbi:MAG: phosphonate degradation HD-domain oxygenase [Elainella sp.]
MLSITLDHLVELLLDRGTQQYDGEAVSQLDHALQAAAQAQSQSASPSLITACLLHDVGHLLESQEFTVAADCRHEYRALPLLQPLFEAAVTEPIRLHVAAKQYLCAVDPQYWARLSVASQQSLERQGGRFTPALAQQFAAQPFAQDAIQLRRWDDQAKVAGAPTPALVDLMPIVRGCLRPSARPTP